MKRFVVLCVVFLVFLVGCNKKEDAKPILNNIEFSIDITYYNEKYTAKGSIDADNNLELELKEPKELAGMVFYNDADGIKISYKGLVYEPNSNTLMPSAFGMLYSALNAAKSENAVYEYGDKNYSVSAENEQGEFLINFSPSGLPLDIKYLSGAFYAEITDLKMLKNE